MYPDGEGSFTVEPENAAAFLSQPGIDGVLIGGASLKAEEFLAVLEDAMDVASGELAAR